MHWNILSESRIIENCKKYFTWLSWFMIGCFCVIKFIYSEKATKSCEIFPILLTVCMTDVKSKGKISKNFAAFSEYMNFNNLWQIYYIVLNKSHYFALMKFHQSSGINFVEFKSELYFYNSSQQLKVLCKNDQLLRPWNLKSSGWFVTLAFSQRLIKLFLA